MHACTLLLLCSAAFSQRGAAETAEEFRQLVQRRSVVWSDPTERDHREAVALMKQLDGMGPAGQPHLERIVVPTLAAALADSADGARWDDTTERDHQAVRNLVVRNLVKYLAALGSAADRTMARDVAPELIAHLKQTARRCNWSDATERDHVAVQNLANLLSQLGPAAEPAIERDVASALGEVFVYHAVRRNPNWRDPGERDHAAARNVAGLLYKLGPPAYTTLADPVLTVLAGQDEAPAQQLADRISRAQLRGTVLGADFDRREIAVRDRMGRRRVFKVAPNAQVGRGATIPGANVVVDFDLRDFSASRIVRSQF
jgi:hypothetical protein